MDVVDAISRVATAKRFGTEDVPTFDVFIRSVRRDDNRALGRWTSPPIRMPL